MGGKGFVVMVVCGLVGGWGWWSGRVQPGRLVLRLNSGRVGCVVCSLGEGYQQPKSPCSCTLYTCADARTAPTPTHPSTTHPPSYPSLLPTPPGPSSQPASGLLQAQHAHALWRRQGRERAAEDPGVRGAGGGLRRLGRCRRPEEKAPICEGFYLSGWVGS